MEEVRPGLWHWRAPHPEWTPGDGARPDGWEQDVSCYAYVADDALVLIDPLNVPHRLEDLRAGVSTAVLLTTPEPEDAGTTKAVRAALADPDPRVRACAAAILVNFGAAAVQDLRNTFAHVDLNAYAW